MQIRSFLDYLQSNDVTLKANSLSCFASKNELQRLFNGFSDCELITPLIEATKDLNEDLKRFSDDYYNLENIEKREAENVLNQSEIKVWLQFCFIYTVDLLFDERGYLKPELYKYLNQPIPLLNEEINVLHLLNEKEKALHLNASEFDNLDHHHHQMAKELINSFYVNIIKAALIQSQVGKGYDDIENKMFNRFFNQEAEEVLAQPLRIQARRQAFLEKIQKYPFRSRKLQNAIFNYFGIRKEELRHGSVGFTQAPSLMDRESKTWSEAIAMPGFLTAFNKTTEGLRQRMTAAIVPNEVCQPFLVKCICSITSFEDGSIEVEFDLNKLAFKNGNNVVSIMPTSAKVTLKFIKNNDGYEYKGMRVKTDDILTLNVIGGKQPQERVIKTEHDYRSHGFTSPAVMTYHIAREELDDLLHAAADSPAKQQFKLLCDAIKEVKLSLNQDQSLSTTEKNRRTLELARFIEHCIKLYKNNDEIVKTIYLSIYTYPNTWQEIRSCLYDFIYTHFSYPDRKDFIDERKKLNQELRRWKQKACLEPSFYNRAILQYGQELRDLFDTFFEYYQHPDDRDMLISCLQSFRVLLQDVKNESKAQHLLDLALRLSEGCTLRNKLLQSRHFFPATEYTINRAMLCSTLKNYEGRPSQEDKDFAKVGKTILQECDKLHADKRSRVSQQELTSILKLTDKMICQKRGGDEVTTLNTKLAKRNGARLLVRSLCILAGLALIGLSVTVGLFSFGVLAPVTILGSVLGASLILGSVAAAVGTAATVTTGLAGFTLFKEINRSDTKNLRNNLSELQTKIANRPVDAVQHNPAAPSS